MIEVLIDVLAVSSWFIIFGWFARPQSSKA